MEERDYQAQIDDLRQWGAGLKKTINEQDAKIETLRTQNSELERMVQFLKGQIEAYQYCLNCRR